MTDSNDDDRRGRPPRGGSDRGRTGGSRPTRDGAAPRKPREGGERPFRARDGDERRPPRAGGDKPFHKPRDAGDRPSRPRPDGDRPFRGRDDARPRPPREGGERPFRARSEDGDRPRRSEGERPFRARPDGDRPRPTSRPSRPAPHGDDRLSRPREEPPVAAVPQEPAEDRIAKVIARAGVASRRDAEAMIAEGRVTLNGKVLTSPAQNVTPADVITVDGEPLPVKERTRLWLFHKPRGLVTTARDPEGRATVFENLPEDLPRVVAIGRLDINTEGLLLLTNDGGLAKVIAHPDTGWLRRYKVRAHGDVTQADLDRLRDGVTIDEMEYGPVEARLDRVQGDNAWITLGLREGKNREVKRILEHLGLQVNRLIRLSFGPFQLGELEPGLVEEVKTKVLRDQLGDKLAQEAGVDFESPVREPIAPFGAPPRQDQRQDQPERGERPSRHDREERPRRRDEGDRPVRSRDAERPARGRRDEAEAPKRPDRNAPKRSVWRAGEDETETHRSKAPRRGADPREARAATAERPRQRAAAIQTGEGRTVKVERLVSTAEPEDRPLRKPRRDMDRPAPRSDDRPRRRTPDFEPGPDRSGQAPWEARGGSARPRRDDDRPPRRETGDRPFRPRPESDERPRGPRPGGDRPFRSRDGDAPARGRSGEDDRPRRGPPPRSSDRGGAFKGPGGPRGGPGGRSGGGFKGGPGGSKGGPRGGSKGGPKGRRP